jgi:hypothetical protein
VLVPSLPYNYGGLPPGVHSLTEQSFGRGVELVASKGGGMVICEVQMGDRRAEEEVELMLLLILVSSDRTRHPAPVCSRRIGFRRNVYKIPWCAVKRLAQRERATQRGCVLTSSMDLWKGPLGVKLQSAPTRKVGIDPNV